ncbi:MAG TPA: hypothetical protein VHT30_10235 [Acidimicrobiales bacterium]|nr:hypothetical protein [Acidimicrobiales bacterium]
MPITAASAAGSLTPGNLLVSTSVWTTDANITSGTTQLPPNCGSRADNPCATAIANGTYPIVFNNDAIDGSFGVTQPIVLDELNPTTGAQITSVEVPNSSQGLGASADQMVTSFSSKSEIALNQATDLNDVTFMGYVAPVAALDVSNSDTPGAVDITNSAGTTPYYRAVAQLDPSGNFQYTETNAYSGNNGRSAIFNPTTSSFYMTGNAGNGANPEPQGVVEGVGSQIMAPANAAESAQSPKAPTPMGNFNIRQLPANTTSDKSAKDDNFRGLTVSNNVIYYSKGSGSNGINTVYFLDTTGTACPSTGVGVPASGATLPSAATFPSPTYSTSTPALGLTTTNPGLTPTNTCVLNGFPTVLAKTATDSSMYPFGIWFANPTTVYVADEGAGDNTYSASPSPAGQYTAAAASTTAGLEKWTFDGSKWNLAYTLQNGLNLGTPYTVASSGGNSYPTGTNSFTNTKGTTTTGPWTPAVDGLRNLTGKVNGDGTVTLWATTSTVSFSGDQGADPNALVSITDNLGDTTAAQASTESFSTPMMPTYGQVVRGVSFTPATGIPGTPVPEVPWAPLLPLSAAIIGGGILWERSRRRGRQALPLAV